MARSLTDPTPLAQRSNYSAVRPGQNEATNEALWDFGAYPAAGAGSLTFFQVQQGAIVNGIQKTYGDTNMTLAGQLSAGISFEARALEFQFFPGGAVGLASNDAAALKFADDIYSVMSSAAWIEIYYLSKVYQRIPISLVPPTTRLNLQAAVSDVGGSTEVRSSVNYAAWCGPLFQLVPFNIDQNTNFNVSLNFAAAVPLPSGIAARCGIILRGIRTRVSQ